MRRCTWRGVLDFGWSKLKGVARATRKGYYSMQDGASSHTTNENQERVTSNKTAYIRPPKSPDMNPIDFFLTDLKDMVDNFCQELEPDLIKKVCRSVHVRDNICIQQKGGHFEHIKDRAQKELNN